MAGRQGANIRESTLSQPLMAKLIILGDPRTGKSRLVNSLDSRGAGGGGKYRDGSGGSSSSSANDAGGGGGGGGGGGDDNLFSVVEFPAHELESTTSDVYLKMWEHTKDLSVSEQELVFRGALFCIITLDLRYPDTAKSAFSKWLQLKEAQMPESFLFVVGTFLDQSISRRVEIAELCKLCAQRDAVYLEVSNLDGSNISLLRRLIAQRINYMLRVRETVARQALPDLSGHDDLVDDALDDSTADDHDGADESKRANNVFHIGSTAAERRESALKTPFLEQEIVCDSVGSILASCLGTEFWPGYEQEEENLKQIGEHINDYVHRLAADPASAPSTPLEHILHSTAPALAATSQQHAASFAASPKEADMEELKRVFEVMGFQVPPSLLTAAISTGQKRSLELAMPSTKLRVKLPDGQSADMILYPHYHVGQQVDAFLVQHSIEDNEDAKAKLVEAAKKVVAAAARQHDAHEDEDVEHQQQHIANHQNTLLTAPPRLASGTASFSNLPHGSAMSASPASRHTHVNGSGAVGSGKLGRKCCRVKISLPSGKQIETLMRENEDLVALSKRIAGDYGLTPQYQEKVLHQLRATFK